MSLVADYGSDSDSSVENEGIVIKTEVKTEPILNGEETKLLVLSPMFKLPTPKFSGETNTGDTDSQVSVFLNPFLEAENAKQAILQKHVKMVDTKDSVIINGKKICWNYRKGRCRFGHNCKYAHDSDLQKSQEQLDAELETARAQSVICHFSGSNSSLAVHHHPPEDFEAIKEVSNSELGTKNEKKRKRPGLSQGLVPGKRVMKQYLHNKN